jgi:glycosyltransferase involved in cell wall biosynthesis
MNAPIFSLIMPAYNAEAYLEEAIDSVFGQATRFAFEVVLVNDGSADSTAHIGQSYSGLRYISQTNAGAAAARNAGVVAASTSLILFLDADDRAMPGRFDIQVSHMVAEQGVDLCFGNWMVENEIDNYLAHYGLSGCPDHFHDVSDALDRLLAVGCFVPTSTVALRCETFLRDGGFPVDRHCADDHALWCRIASSGGRLTFIDRQLAW